MNGWTFYWNKAGLCDYEEEPPKLKRSQSGEPAQPAQLDQPMQPTQRGERGGMKRAASAGLEQGRAGARNKSGSSDLSLQQQGLQLGVGAVGGGAAVGLRAGGAAGQAAWGGAAGQAAECLGGQATGMSARPAGPAAGGAGGLAAWGGAAGLAAGAAAGATVGQAAGSQQLILQPLSPISVQAFKDAAIAGDTEGFLNMLMGRSVHELLGLQDPAIAHGASILQLALTPANEIQRAPAPHPLEAGKQLNGYYLSSPPGATHFCFCQPACWGIGVMIIASSRAF